MFLGLGFGTIYFAFRVYVFRVRLGTIVCRFRVYGFRVRVWRFRVYVFRG